VATLVGLSTIDSYKWEIDLPSFDAFIGHVFFSVNLDALNTFITEESLKLTKIRIALCALSANRPLNEIVEFQPIFIVYYTGLISALQVATATFTHSSSSSLSSSPCPI
jgi:hypothetical protein